MSCKTSMTSLALAGALTTALATVAGPARSRRSPRCRPRPMRRDAMHEMYRSDAVTLAAFNPALAGAGLKHEHAQAIFSGVRAADFFEVHAENYMGDGGPPHRLL